MSTYCVIKEQTIDRMQGEHHISIAGNEILQRVHIVVLGRTDYKDAKRI